MPPLHRRSTLPALRAPAAALLCAALAAGLLGGQVAAAVPAQALTAENLQNVQAANQAAADRGFRSGVAVLDLTTGEYAGSGEDTAPFPSESVAKVLIATQLLLSGQMTGDTGAAAYRMITASDDDAANALYPRAGGDAVVSLVAAHYGIAGLGAPPSRPGWWGLTQVTAKGLVQLYAAIARDPAVYPWLSDAMAHATTFGADGTYQLFGLPAAAPGAAIKQGWGHDGAAGNAVANSTGYTDGGRFAVAILTEGPPGSYGTAITDAVTAQAKALLPEGRLGDAPAVAPQQPAPAAAPAAQPRDDAAAHVRAWFARHWPAVAGALALAGALGACAWAVRRLGSWLRRRRELRAEAGRRRARARAVSRALADGRGGAVVQLSSGRLVRIAARPASSPRPAYSAGPATRGRPIPSRAA